MPYTLKGRNVLVTGGSRGLGALICKKFAQEGCNIAVNYISSEQAANDVVKEVEGYGVKAIALQGDCGVADDNTRLVKETVEKLGGIDIIIANAGWTRFAEFKDLNSLSHDEWNKCWHTNVMQHLQLMQAAGPIFDQNPDGGAYIITSSIAGISQAGSSMGYSVTKAAGLHLMKCLAATQGPKIRVNAVLPGLLLTEWGLRYPKDRITELQMKALLKQETLLDDCADAFVSLAKNASMTGQEIRVDSGLVMGASQA